MRVASASLGAIDGKHVRIKAPANSGSLFYNYKQYFSLVLLAVADARSRMVYFHMGSYGHESDAGIFDRSDFARRMRAGQLSLPPPAKLPGSDKVLSHYFVGDCAFPLSTTLMKPYPMRDLSGAQRIYNYRSAFLNEKFHFWFYRISRARRIVETTFGIMAARFRILQRPIESSPARVDDIVKAICCLHNFLIDELGQPVIPAAEVDQAAGMMTRAQMRRLNANRAPDDADVMREQLLHYFSNEGAVEFQDAYA